MSSTLLQANLQASGIENHQLMQVLHVDDDQSFLETSKSILQLQNTIRVTSIDSVDKAIKLLESTPFDVIVSDYQMPKKDGMQFLKEIRKNGNTIPFILFTGKGREEVAKKALNLGANYYLNKNGKPEAVYSELAHCISTVVNSKKIENAFRENEKEKTAILDNMSELVTHQDLKHKILWANKKAAESVKLKPEQLMGSYCHEIWANSFTPCNTCPIEKVIKTGQTQHGEITSPDGRIWSITGQPRKNVKGEVTSVVEVTSEITVTKKAEEKLRQEREIHELVTSSVNAGLTIISKDYKILWANRFLKEVSGKDVKGKNCFAVYNDRDSVCPGCGVKEVFETGKENVVHEQAVPGPDGQRHWIEITANPIRDKKGNIVAASEFSVYVNDRKNLEIKLREAEKRYHSIFYKAPLGILIIDSKGTAIEFNEEAHHQLGYSREEFEKLTVSDYEVIETPKEIMSRMQTILKTGKDEFETMHQTKTGERRDIKNTVQVIELSGKKYYQVITQDITEQKRAEKNLQDDAEKYRELLNGMNDTAWVIDFDCSIIDVNNAAVEIFGYSREEFQSIGLAGIDSNLDPKQIKAFVEGMPADEIQVFETVHTCKTGKKIPVEISSSLVTYQGKKAILSIARDITERKQTEAKLENMLNDIVAFNEKLGVVGKLTRHDARNKLSVIANNAYLAKQNLAANHDALVYLDSIQSAIDQINKIFEFARNYEMLGVEDLVYVDVKKNFDEATMLFSGSAKVNFVNECQGLRVMADSLLTKVFYNLIDDTLKHGEEFNKIRIYYEEAENQLKLIYEDDGVGISENEKENIFNEGYGKGTGYGLYLIKKICESYGWVIKETGKHGKGAKFTLNIPKKSKSGKLNYHRNF